MYLIFQEHYLKLYLQKLKKFSFINYAMAININFQKFLKF